MDKLYFLQFLRAVAAFIVLLVHVGNEVAQSYNLDYKLVNHNLVIGVDIFFIISGFLMVYTTNNWEGGKSDFIKFIKNRLKRILPLYYIYTFLAVIALIFFSSQMSNPGLEFSHIINSFFFIPAFYPGTDSIQPVLRVGWTLNYEMYFYLLFSLGILISQNYRLILTSTLITLLYIFFNLFTFDTAISKFYSNNIVFEFIIGIIFCKIYLKMNNKFHIFALTYIFISGITFFFIEIDNRLFTYGIPASIIFLCAWLIFQFLQINKYILNFFIFLGNASYTTYLSHMFVIVVFNLLFYKYLHWMNVYLYFYISVFFTLTTCLFLYIIVEIIILRNLFKSRVSK